MWAMQQVISGALALSEERAHAVAIHAQRIGLGSVVQATLAVFTQHPLPILVCSLLCFAGVVITGALSYLALVLHGLASQGSYFAITANAFYLQMQIQAAIGAFTFLIGRGAITWIALHTPAGADGAASQPISLRAAFGAALRRWQPLLASSLLYGLLITISLVGITWMLREVRLDVSNYRWVRRDAHSILNLTLVRAIAQLPPDPGSPFTELYSATRYHLSRQSGSYLGWSLSQPSPSDLSTPLLAAGIAGALLVFITEALLWEPVEATNTNGLAAIEEFRQIEEERAPGQKPRWIIRSYYIISLLEPIGPNRARIRRKFWFDRTRGLLLVRQQVFGEAGEIRSEIRYEEFATAPNSSSLIPVEIRIARPYDRYSIRLGLDRTSLVVNGEVSQALFRLEKPAEWGDTVRVINLDRKGN